MDELKSNNQILGKRWIKISLINLLVVALLGLLMRYKIGFDFPYFLQKNILHAHSHFALYGWISLIVMSLMVKEMSLSFGNRWYQSFNLLLSLQLVSAYGMLFSFFAQGYGAVSISFSTLSLLLSFAFGILYWLRIKGHSSQAKPWFSAAIVFNILSTLGTFYLSYMMASKRISQDMYLASIYWFLHFQYNGWIFFAIGGLFVQYLEKLGFDIKIFTKIFKLFAYSCIPAFGLSVLWMKLPLYIFIPVVLASFLQIWALFLLVRFLRQSDIFKRLKISRFERNVLRILLATLSIKFLLQLGSTHPDLSQLAFGFRPIVIAYLHLVLLAFSSLFLVHYCYLNRLMVVNRFITRSLIVLIIGIFLNEAALAIQGGAGIIYFLVPYMNETLFVISIVMVIGLIGLNCGNLFTKHEERQNG